MICKIVVVLFHLISFHMYMYMLTFIASVRIACVDEPALI